MKRRRTVQRNRTVIGKEGQIWIGLSPCCWITFMNNMNDGRQSRRLMERNWCGFLSAVGRTASVIGYGDIVEEAKQIAKRVKGQKERQWTAEEALMEMVPLLRCFYEAGEAASAIVPLSHRQEPEATILLCGNDPLFFAYVRGALQTVPWRFTTIPSLEQAAASMFRLSPDCIIVSVKEGEWENPDLTVLLERAGQRPYLPVVIVRRDEGKEGRLKGYELGADDVITTPAADELFVRVRRLIEKNEKSMTLCSLTN